jgi:heme exporter protein B
MTGLNALLRRDVLLALRQGGGAGTALGFFLTVVVLLPLGLGPDLQLLQRIAPGALWIALLLSVLLSAERIFQADYEDGSLELLTLGPAALEMVVATKAVAHWLTAGLPLALAAPLLGFLLNLAPDLVLPLGLAMLTGSLALSLLASLGAALTVGLRRGGLLISLIVLPLYVPVMVFGVAASSGGEFAAPFMILLAIVLVSSVVVPFAAASALRAHLR